jgi:hypothetical protein
MKTVSPLIICGMGRSGTRNTANVLNCHDEVMLFGEVPLGVMKEVFDLLDTIDKTYSRKDYHVKLWARKKAQFVYSSFNYIGKAPLAKEKRSARFIGHKTPHHEKLFEDYERHFQSVDVQPVYLYCCRDVKSCWRSYKSMNWGSKRTLESFLKEYEESYAHLQLMRSKAKNRVHLVKLNDLIAAPNQVEFYRETLFKPLGLDLDSDTAQKIASLENGNATVKVTGRPPLELTDQEVQEIEGHLAVQEIQRRHFK